MAEELDLPSAYRLCPLCTISIDVQTRGWELWQPGAVLVPKSMWKQERIKTLPVFTIETVTCHEPEHF